MIWLVQDFGFLSVVLRALVLSLQTLMVGGVVFVALALPEDVALAVRRRCLIWLVRFGLGFAVVEALYVATDTAIMVSSTGFPVGDFAGAAYFLAGSAGVGLGVLIAVVAARWRRGADVVLAVLAAMVMMASLCTSHAVSRTDQRVPTAVLTVLHQTAASAWIGGMFFVLVCLRTEFLRSNVAAARGMLRRYARVAVVGVVTLIGSGVGLSVYYIGSLPALVGTAYGFMVICKVALLCALLALGAVNFSLGRRGEFAAATMTLLGRLSEIELWIGFTVIVTAASLTSQPPAIDLVQGRLTGHEIVSRFTPKRPHFDHPGPETLMPATPMEQAIRNIDNVELMQAHSNRDPDMAWDEFDHHWVGLMLLFIGVGALLSRRYRWARNWPLIFFAMTIFLLLYADPENWPIGPVSFWASFSDPEVLQHRLYFCLLMAYGAFEWGVQTGRLRSQRAAGVFPALLAVGGLALLLHSHSLGNVKQELLIEMSHNTLGILGVLIGCSRWLEIRLRDVPGTGRLQRVAANAWPVMFLMTALVLLNYRES